MPVSDNRLNFKKRRRGSFDPDRENRDRHDQKGHDSVHYYAQRAVIRVCVDGMCECYMDNRQQHQ
jgi:hypothetical protein